MANPKGINQYTKGGGSGKSASPKKSAEVLPPGYTRKGSTIYSPSGFGTYSPRKKVVGNPSGGPVKLSQKRAKAIFNNQYN